MSQVEKTGIALIGQSAALAPADKKLYALRDATSTVDSIPLIASSIMSKKLAAGAHNIVLDVKVGSGAFMKDEESAEALAGTMVSIGKACGRNVRALITNMDVPLGKAVGNSLEVIEAIDVLKGKLKGDIREICVMLAANMVSMIRDIDTAEAAALAETAIDSGEALAKMKEWIEAQGADASYIDDTDKFPKAPFVKTVVSGTDGYIGKMESKHRVSVYSQPGPGTQRAQTRYRTLAFKDGLSLMACRLLTGRTHQIRAQFAAAGHPLLGDNQYGNARQNEKYHRTYQALYACRLTFDFKGDAGILNPLNGRSWGVPEVRFAETYFPDYAYHGATVDAPAPQRTENPMRHN